MKCFNTLILKIKYIKGLIWSYLHCPKRLCFRQIGVYTSISNKFIDLIGVRFLKIGNRVRIYPGFRIEVINLRGRVNLTIEDNVLINQNFHCTCGESIRIHKGTSITANCGICDIVHPYSDIYQNPRSQKYITIPVEIGEDCLIGMNSVIMPGVILGNHVIVGANSVVLAGSYPSFCVLAGNPAKIIKQYSFDKSEWIKVAE